MGCFQCGDCGNCGMNSEGCSKRTNNKLDTYDWLSDIPQSREATDFVEVTFKNTRKGYYRNSNGLQLVKGDIVAVEANPGHDIGTVSLVGQLVLLQMRKYKVDPMRSEMKRVYRIAKQVDLDKWEESKAKEADTMLQARKIAEDLQLNMKIGDVEYQGDGNKAIFYYIADERVDFRQLIKVLAATFKVRIEMKQIGARQEAGRIGGIGPCGRPLCCSCWMTNFVSVSTSAARYQEMSLNPQKQAGQCAKLKCCLNFELDAYLEAQKQIPARDIPLETKMGTYYHFKTDVFGQTMQYSSDPHMAANIVTLSVERVKEIIALNKQGIQVDDLQSEDVNSKEQNADYGNVVGQDSLTRFDKKKGQKGGGRDRRDRDGRDRHDNRDRQNQNREGLPTDDNQQTEPNQADAPQQEEQSQQNSQQRDNRRNDRRDNRDRRDRRDNRDRDNRRQDNQPRQNEGEQPSDNAQSQGGENQSENTNTDRQDRPRNNDRRDRDNRRDRRDNRNRGPRNNEQQNGQNEQNGEQNVQPNESSENQGQPNDGGQHRDNRDRRNFRHDRRDRRDNRDRRNFGRNPQDNNGGNNNNGQQSNNDNKPTGDNAQA